MRVGGGVWGELHSWGHIAILTTHKQYIINNSDQVKLSYTTEGSQCMPVTYGYVIVNVLISPCVCVCVSMSGCPCVGVH